MDLNKKTLTADIVNSLCNIGYLRDYIKFDYQFSDFFENTPILRSTNIGIFGREPFDYRSACISINYLDEENKTNPVNFRAFGSPHSFFVKNGYTERWNNNAKDIKLIETIETNQLPNYIKHNSKYLKPEYVIRKKSDFSKPISFQPDLFIDSGLIIALDNEASIRVDYIIRNLISEIENIFRLKGKPYQAEHLFKLIFILLTAKLLNDRDIVTIPSIDFSNYKTVIEGVSNFYSSKIYNELSTINDEILKSAVTEISKTISLRNLSIDTLTYIYENTFVSPENRKSLGIHSTPSYVADYILTQIPFDDIPLNKLNIFDPMCGHGIFLVSAMRKLKNHLPIDWNGKKRHQYFTKHLWGVEIDSFAIEVAQMCLTLADFPEANGWQLKQSNIFKGKYLEQFCEETTIFVGNPPFEYENYESRQYPKPALLLDLALPKLPKNSFIGIVLPSSFLDSVDYRKTRELFLRDFSVLSITNLPPNTFLHSSSETSTIVAKKGEFKKQIYYSEVNSNHIDKFKYDYSKTWEINLIQDYFQNKSSLKVPLLNEIWTYLDAFEKLDSIAEIKIGVQNEPSLVRPQIDYKPERFENSVPAIISPKINFYQYLTNQKYFIPSEMKKRRRFAWDYDWTIPKVVVPTGRVSSGPWKFAAALDYEGRYATRNFFAVWSNDKKITIEVLAAILNSPLAAAYVFTSSTGRSIPKRVYKAIPIPKDIIYYSEEITSMVKDFISFLIIKDFIKAKTKLFELDALILKLYKLPPEFEFKLLRLFYNQKRPVPFDFNGYYPKEYNSWIPLHIYISKKYKGSTIGDYLDFFPKIKNKETIKFIENLE